MSAHRTCTCALTGLKTMAVLSGLLLAGCGHDRLPAAGPAEFVKTDVHLDHQVRFSTGRDSLTAADRQQLARFLAEADPEADGDISISIGPGNSRRLTYLQDLLMAEGRGWSSRVEPHRGPDIAILSIDHEVLLPTRCAGAGLWDSDIADSSEGLPLGCTTSMNLSAMIDNRDDLLRGRPLGPAAAAPAVDIARHYLSRWSDKPPYLALPTADDGIGEPASGAAPSDPADMPRP